MPLHRSMTSKSKGEGASLGRKAQGLGWESHSTASGKENCKFEDFLIYWLHGSFPLDKAGILVLARAYKIHVTVFFNDHYWTTNTSSNLNECTVFLIYCGDLVFMDSRRLLTKELDEHRPLMQKLKKYYDTPAADKPLQRHQVHAARKVSTIFAPTSMTVRVKAVHPVAVAAPHPRPLQKIL